MRLAWLLLWLAACHPRGATCPTSAPVAADSAIRMTGLAPARELEIARTAADARARMSSPAYDAFVAATDFAADELAIVRTTDGRQYVTGMSRDGDRVTLHLGTSCPPCAGGDPGSFERARAEYDAATAPATIVQRVPHGARVSITTCGGPTCTCRHDIP